jgi:cellulose synthase/poly-beta-1,6-N-acetylglucosamine synthase-like glycosyltransferase
LLTSAGHTPLLFLTYSPNNLNAPRLKDTELIMTSLSILVPNFNYGRYIGETISSALAEADKTVEVVVCDNASTDDSIAVVQAIAAADPRVRYSINACNVGFAANLERVAAMAKGQRMLLLSSDDRIGNGALPAYARLTLALGADAEHAVWGSATTIIDSTGVLTGHVEPDPKPVARR